MLRALKIHLPFAADNKSRRRRHQFTPAVSLSASNLEERALLSAAGGAAATAHQAAVQARHEAQFARHEARMEVRHAAQLVHREAKLARREARLAAHNPSSARAAALAHTVASMQAAIAADPAVSVSPTGVVTVTGPTGTIVGGVPGAAGTTTTGNLTTPGSVLGTTSTSTTIAPSSVLGGLSALNPGGFGVSRMLPGGLTNSVVGTFNSGLPSAFVSGSGTPSIVSGMGQVPFGATIAAPTGSGVSVTTANTTTSLNSVAGNVSTGTVTQTNFPSTATATGSTISPLGSLLTTGMVPTPGLNTATGGTVPVSTLTFTPTLSTSGQSPTGTFNSSPLPFNGTMPFTGTPFNPSPLGFGGTLPFTRSPINPSPTGFTGTLA